MSLDKIEPVLAGTLEGLQRTGALKGREDIITGVIAGGGVRTLLELAEAAGLSPAYACRSGICGSCATRPGRPRRRGREHLVLCTYLVV